MEDLKCELQLFALDVWEPSKYEFDLGHFLKQIKKYEDKWVSISEEKVLLITEKAYALLVCPMIVIMMASSMPS